MLLRANLIDAAEVERLKQRATTIRRRASCRAHYRRNREKRLAKTARWRAKNPEKWKASYKNWKQLNARRVHQTAKAYVEAHRARVNENHRNWIKSNPIKARAIEARIWAKRQNAPGSCSAEQLQARFAFYGNQCAYCGGPPESADHVIPLSRGGSNWPANIRPACMRCNVQKKNRKLHEWKRAA